MKTFLVLPVLLSLSFAFIAQSAMAASIFVADAQGANLSRAQGEKVTQMVRKAVENMPEHKLVQSESEADFVLHPAITRKGSAQILRIEKQKGGDLIAVAEQPLNMRGSSINAERSAQMGAQSATQTALQSDSYVAQPNTANSNNADRSAGRNPASTDSAFAGSVNGSSMPSDADEMDTRSIHTDAATANTNNNNDNRNPAGLNDALMAPTANTDAMNSDRSGMGTASASDASSAAGSAGHAEGDVRAPSPLLANNMLPGFFQLGVGPSFAVGLDSDNIMYDINGGYNYNISDRFTAKAFGDFNFGTGADAAQLVDLGVGADVYPANMPTFGQAKPYLMGDLGYGFARNGRTKSASDGATIGAGAGFKFEASQLNWDISAHYALLTTQINGKTPSVLGLRAALNF